MNVLVIDNYDSFTYNLVHLFEALGAKATVWRNDSFDLDELKPFHKIVLSPGPGIPDDAGLLKEVIREFSPTKSILGVCLGQQAIAEVFGGSLINLEKPFHGIATEIEIVDKEEPLFGGLPQAILVGRYHSWAVSPSLPESLVATSFSNSGEVMSLKHQTYDLRGVQFHPESVLTPDGRTILRNWLSI
jgi:anthranilate synthase component 2